MTPEEIADLVHLRRARDLMDRDYAQPLDVPAMARTAVTDTCVAVGCTSLGSFGSRSDRDRGPSGNLVRIAQA